MSRCYCCNKILTPRELSTKFAVSGEFTEMCFSCLSTIDASYDEPEFEDESEDEDGSE